MNKTFYRFRVVLILITCSKSNFIWVKEICNIYKQQFNDHVLLVYSFTLSQ